MSWQHQEGIGRNNLDFVRFALAVAVIFAHSYALLQGSDNGEPLLRATHGQITFGGLAVDWFFVISGFLIAHSWLRSPSTLEYFKKRVLRIYPGFIGAVLFSTFVVAPLASPVIRQNFLVAIKPFKWLAYLAVLQFHEPHNVFLNNPIHAINGSLWTIPYEFWCYIGIALLGLLSFLKKPLLILFCFVVLQVISILFTVHNWNPSNGLLFRAALAPSILARLWPYYLAGTTFYLFRQRIPVSGGIALASAFLLIIAALIPTWGLALFMPWAGTYALFWFAFTPGIRLENWARYGDFSYGIYVFAFPIQQLLIMKMGTAISPWKLFAFSTPLCIAAGFLSWHLIERRFLKLKKKSVAEMGKELVAEVSGSP